VKLTTALDGDWVDDEGPLGVGCGNPENESTTVSFIEASEKFNVKVPAGVPSNPYAGSGGQAGGGTSFEGGVLPGRSSSHEDGVSLNAEFEKSSFEFGGRFYVLGHLRFSLSYELHRDHR
jgi:hypothetical protein